MKDYEIIVATPEQMIELGEVLARSLRPGDRLLLAGNLGAGKTTLAKGIARGLGFAGMVTSPTFTIQQVYPGRIPVYHLDYYRLGDDRDPEEWEESYYGDGVTLIEWPAPDDYDPASIRVDIEIVNDDYESPRRVRLTFPADRPVDLEDLNRHADPEH